VTCRFRRTETRDPQRRTQPISFDDLEVAGWPAIVARNTHRPCPVISIAVLQLLDGTLVGMLSCSEDAGEVTIGRGRDAMVGSRPHVSRLHATVRQMPRAARTSSPTTAQTAAHQRRRINALPASSKARESALERPSSCICAVQ
jgi:hypothetical protein